MWFYLNEIPTIKFLCLRLNLIENKSSLWWIFKCSFLKMMLKGFLWLSHIPLTGACQWTKRWPWISIMNVFMVCLLYVFMSCKRKSMYYKYCNLFTCVLQVSHLTFPKVLRFITAVFVQGGILKCSLKRNRAKYRTTYTVIINAFQLDLKAFCSFNLLYLVFFSWSARWRQRIFCVYIIRSYPIEF